MKLKFVFTDSQIYSLLVNSSQYDINLDLLTELNRYYISRTFYDRFKINEMGKILGNFYSANKHLIYENKSFILNNIINKEFNQNDTKKLEIYTDYLIYLLSNFTNHINDLSSNQQLIAKHLIDANYFYEHCVLRPVYLFLNVFDDKNSETKKYLEGKHYFKLTLIITLFLKVSLFYGNYMNKINSTLQNDLKQKILFEKHDNSIIITNFSIVLIDHIKETLAIITEEKIKYYEYATLIDICRRIMCRFIKINETVPYTDQNRYIKQIDSAFEHYETKLNKTNDSKLCIINELQSYDGSNNFSEILLDYLIYTMIKYKPVYTKEKKKNNMDAQTKKIITLNNFRFENSFALILLNKLIINDSKRFQSILINKERLEINYSYLNFLSRYIIFGNLLYEISLSNEIESVANRSSLIYDLLQESIKFIQNLCEGHNTNFQNILFNYSISEEEDENSQTLQKISEFKVIKKSITMINIKINKDLERELHSSKLTGINRLYTENLSISSIINQINKDDIKYDENFTSIKEKQIVISPNIEQYCKHSFDIPLKRNIDMNDLTVLNRNNTEEFNKWETIASPNNEFPNRKIFNSAIFEHDKNEIEKIRKMMSIDLIKENSNILTPEMRISEKNNTEEHDFESESESEEDDELNTKGEDELKKMYNLGDKNAQKHSFLNYIQLQMKLIFFYVHKGASHKDFSRIVNIFKLFNDLIIEMVQGTRPENLLYFFNKNINSDLINSTSSRITLDMQLYEYFAFLKLNEEIKCSILSKKDIFNTKTIKIKIAIFKQINNLLNTESTNKDLIKILVLFYDPEQLINLICKYLIALYVKYVLENKDEDNFYKNFFDTEINFNHLRILMDKYKTDYRIFNDEYFILSSEIFLFLMMIGDKFENDTVKNFLLLSPNDCNCKESKLFNIAPDIDLKKKVFHDEAIVNFKKKGNLDESIEERETKLHNMMISRETLVLCSKFFQSIIRNCDFSFPTKEFKSTESNIKQSRNLKRMYFITDPRVFLLSKKDINSMIQQLDIRDDTAKIKFMFEQLHYFFNEIEYKESQDQKSKIKQYLNDFNYIIVDKINLLFSIVINLILLITLNVTEINYELNLVYFIEMIQITINLLFISAFFYSKYFKYVMLETSKKKAKKLGFLKKLYIYIFNCLIFNNEVDWLIVNLFIGLLIMIRPTYIFLYCLQLLAVIKFVPSISAILIAFKLRISQLLQMIGLLIILINFYANLSYHFLRDEFIIEMNDVYFI